MKKHTKPAEPHLSSEQIIQALYLKYKKKSQMVSISKNNSDSSFDFDDTAHTHKVDSEHKHTDIVYATKSLHVNVMQIAQHTNTSFEFTESDSNDASSMSVIRRSKNSAAFKQLPHCKNAAVGKGEDAPVEKGEECSKEVGREECSKEVGKEKSAPRFTNNSLPKHSDFCVGQSSATAQGSLRNKATPILSAVEQAKSTLAKRARRSDSISNVEQPDVEQPVAGLGNFKFSDEEDNHTVSKRPKRGTKVVPERNVVSQHTGTKRTPRASNIKPPCLSPGLSRNCMVQPRKHIPVISAVSQCNKENPEGLATLTPSSNPRSPLVSGFCVSKFHPGSRFGFDILDNVLMHSTPIGQSRVCTSQTLVSPALLSISGIASTSPEHVTPCDFGLADIVPVRSSSKHIRSSSKSANLEGDFKWASPAGVTEVVKKDTISTATSTLASPFCFDGDATSSKQAQVSTPATSPLPPSILWKTK